MTIKALYLVDVFLNSLVFLDSSCVNFRYCCIALLVSITTSARTRVFLVWLKSGLARLNRLPTSIISRIRGRRLLSLNVFLKIPSLKKPIIFSILIVYFFHYGCKLLYDFSPGIGCFFDYLFPAI